MSLLDAMKLFLCYLLNDGTTPGQITATSAADGASICIAQVNENGIVTRAGIGTAVTAI